MRMRCFIFALLIGCGDWAAQGLALYSSQPFAPRFSEATIAALDHMGPVITDEGVNFATPVSFSSDPDLIG